MDILLIFTVGALNVVCFLIGAKVGQKVSKDETIELPNLNPIEAVREHREHKRAEREQERIKTVLENIDNYNGSSDGQKEVPKG